MNEKGLHARASAKFVEVVEAHEGRATVSKDGYVSQEVQVTSGISGNGAAGMAGNVIFGGVIGAVVDGNSGAMNDLTPNPLVVTLRTAAEEQARQDAAAAPAEGRQP